MIDIKNHSKNTKNTMNYKYTLYIVWFSLIITTYTLIRSEKSNIDEKIYSCIRELFFLNAFHFVTEMSTLFEKTTYSCISVIILCIWYVYWFVGGFVALILNEKINDLCTGVILGHLIIYTLIIVLNSDNMYRDCRNRIRYENIDNTDNNDIV